MEDYVKILVLQTLGQSPAVTFKSLFSEACRSTCFNNKCFLFNECKRGHKKKGLKGRNVWASAACYASTESTTAAAACPYLDLSNTQTCASSTPSLHLSKEDNQAQRSLPEK